VVVVIGGKGGVGKTTVAAGLAFALGRRFRVGLVDMDLSGPSVPVLLGVEGPPPVRDGRMVPPRATADGIEVPVMSTGLFGTPDSAFGWQGPVVRGVLRQFVRDVDWGPLDHLVVDTPPGVGELHAAVLDALSPVAAVAVTTADAAALADTRRSLRWFRDVLPVAAVVHNRAGTVCGACGTSDRAGGEDAAAVAALAGDVPVIGLPAVVGSRHPWRAGPEAGAAWEELASLVHTWPDARGTGDSPAAHRHEPASAGRGGRS
jgi:ATP-binding protein involved in chromosome partitioning